LLSSFLKTGQIFSLIGMIHLNLFVRRQSFCVATILAVLISGCVVSDSPVKYQSLQSQDRRSAHMLRERIIVVVERCFGAFQRSGNVREAIGSPRIRQKQ
jgi:hypothetical protein